MTDQRQKADLFRSLHVKGDPIVLYNIWDAGSARAAVAAGAKAVATGSAPVALAHGFADGQRIPLELALDNVRRVAETVSVPVSLDMEGAYSTDPEEGAAHIVRGIEAGAVGVNFEDQVVGGEGLHRIEQQVARISAIRAAIDGTGVAGFINARTDIYLKAMAAEQAPTVAMLDEAVERASAFADAGADGFFSPGLLDLGMIAELCDRVALPVNIIALPGAPENAELAKAGVARISYGPVPYKKMIAWFEEQARVAFGSSG